MICKRGFVLLLGGSEDDLGCDKLNGCGSKVMQPGENSMMANLWGENADVFGELSCDKCLKCQDVLTLS